jgi:hypothetical protein
MTNEGATGLKIPAQQSLLTSAHEGMAVLEAPSPMKVQHISRDSGGSTQKKKSRDSGGLV